MHVHRDVQPVGPEKLPASGVDDAVAAHEPSQGHVQAFERGGRGFRREAAVGAVGHRDASAVGVGQQAPEVLGYRPSRSLARSCRADGAGKVLECAEARVQFPQAAKIVAQVAAEEGAVDVVVGDGFDVAFKHKAQRLAFEQREKALGVAQNHRAAPPRDGGNKERGNLAVGECREAPGKTHGVRIGEFGHIILRGIVVEQGAESVRSIWYIHKKRGQKYEKFVSLRKKL